MSLFVAFLTAWPRHFIIVKMGCSCGKWFPR